MLKRNPIVAILRTKTESDLAPVVEALFEGGLGAVEITLNTPGALKVIAQIGARLGPEQLLGCGTVMNAGEARRAVEAGAGFLVTPILDPPTIDYAVRNKTPIFPGAYSPTEVHRAQSLGAACVKVFPAAGLGPDYLRALLAPMPDLRLMPTGGVTLENLSEWRDAGAAAVGVGTTLCRSEWIERRDYRAIRQAAEEWTREAAGWL